MPVNSFADFPMSWKPDRTRFGKGPVYLALAAALEADIAGGKLAPGTRLPPQRELADFLDINFTTVTRAYDLCREKRLVYGVVGRGTFVASVPGEPEMDESKTIDLGVVQGFPEVGSPRVIEAARAVLARDSAGRLFSYGDRDGMRRHRQAGRQWFEHVGVETDSAHLAVFPGVQSAISTALLSLFRPGEGIAVDTYTFANLIEAARLAHVKLVPIEGDADGMLPQELSAACARGKIAGVFLMPCCANPTTLTLDEARKDELADVIRQTGLLLLEDEARLAAPTRRTRPLFARLPEQTVYLSGTTRLIAPGLRVAYAAFPERFSKALLGGLHHLAIKASGLDAEILGELILSGGAERILAEKRARAMAANRLFNEIFRQRTSRGDVRTFRTLPLPRTFGHGTELERQFAAAGVRILHSDRFCVHSGDSRSFLRVSISSAGTPERLRHGLTLLDGLLKGF